MAHMMRNHIYVTFLISNNSVNDQPADMGQNASLKSHYDSAMDTWT